MQVDTDGSGNIDFQEFLQVITCMSVCVYRHTHIRLYDFQEFLQVIEKQRDSQGDTGEDWDMVTKPSLCPLSVLSLSLALSL